MWAELYPRVLRLAQIAAQHDLNFAIDAEEADRLVLSLKLFEKLAHEPSLERWTGLGIVVQAYQKRGLGDARLAAATRRRTVAGGSWCAWSRAPIGTAK